jgi:hypothetical protein
LLPVGEPAAVLALEHVSVPMVGDLLISALAALIKWKARTNLWA